MCGPSLPSLPQGTFLPAESPKRLLDTPSLPLGKWVPAALSTVVRRPGHEANHTLCVAMPSLRHRSQLRPKAQPLRAAIQQTGGS